MLFGEKLKKLRKERNLTQKQLASMLNVQKSIISYYERDDRLPSWDVLKAMARIFHVSSDYLIGLEIDKTLDVSGLNDEEIAILQNLIEYMRKQKGKQ